MNLYQLKYFQAVCTYRSVSAAAKFLNISQPSLSNSIKELESEFGVSLFHRHHHGMVLTDEGEILLNLSKDILSRSENMEKVMTGLGKKRNLLKLGVPPMLGSLILPVIYENFVKANPDIELEITEGGRDELTQKLKEDMLDMTFISHNVPYIHNFIGQPVSNLEIVCCVSKNNPLSTYKSVTADNLAETPLVLFKNSFFQTEEIKKWFSQSKIIPNILHQTDQVSTIQSLISHDIAAGFMFKYLVNPDSEFIPIPLSTPIHAKVSLIWKKDIYFSDVMNRFKEYIANTNIFEEI